MIRRWLHDAILVDPESGSEAPGCLLLEGERIAARCGPDAPAPESARPTSLHGARLAPGFLDVHHHGELAACQIDDARGALRRASASLVRHGVTAFLPTTIAWPAPELLARVEHIATAIARSEWPGAVPLGLHLEGPWILSAAAGAQPPAGIRPYDPREGAALFDRAGSLLRMVTLAPELPGAAALQAELARRRVVVALGHTLAGEQDVRAAVERGACHVTHLFNAMGCTRHRDPARPDDAPDGFAAVALAHEALGCDLIADGAHVHPDWLRIAARAKRERTVLISDRIDVPASGRDAWLGADRMRSDGVAWRLPDGRLAGSLLTLDVAARNVETWRVMTRAEAIAACTVRPARLLGIERTRGTLAVGARADLVELDAAGEVRATWVAGRRVYAAD
ncbi:MAG: hypothetical protein DCC71_02385 [Proteobacteria bacterium]|nr:MAG: hypothetical protein DCC71_02385 [Pseudomonadota bacterium]